MKFKQILFVILSVCMVGSAFAQLNGNCPGCAYDSAQFGANPSPFAVGLFPDSIVITQDDTVDIDVTYLLPQQDSTGISIAPVATVDEVQILGVNASTPLPIGLNVTCNQYPTCAYYPNTVSRYGCVRICGLTSQAATNGYVLAQITVAGTGSAAGQTETQNQNINFYYKILPDTNACHTVCFQNNVHSGCDSATLGVEAGIDISCPSPILNPCSFEWAYGNGTTGTGLAVQPVTYAAPGVYPVTLHAYQSQLQITGATFSVPTDPATLGFLPCTSGCAWYNDICNGDGVNNSANNFSLNFSIGSSSYSTSGAGGGNLTGTYTGLNYPVTDQAVAISVTDDCLLTTLTSSTATVLITGPGTFTWAAGSDATGSITVTAVPTDTSTYTDTVYIYASPDTPVITVAMDSICMGDSTMLSIDSMFAADKILWYMNDTTYLAAFGDSALSIYVKSAGNYSVKVSNPVTLCQTNSLDVPVYESGLVPASATIYYDNSGNRMFLDPFIGGNYAVWYFDSTLVQGQNGQFLPNLGYGTYYAVVYPTGFPQCSVTSNVYVLKPSGINELPDDISNLSIFPNPNNGAFTMKVDVLTPGNVAIRLTDMLGREVYENTVVNVSGEVRDNINVSALAKGVYTLEVTTDKSRATQRVVVE